MKIAITGHRPNKLGNDYDLKSPLIQRIKLNIIGTLIMNSTGTTRHSNGKYSIDGITCISGMALGIDTLFAQIAIENKIPLIAAIPCIGQESKWPKKSKDIYNQLLSQAGEIVRVTTDEYTPTCMQIRNEWMVNNSNLLIAVWDGSDGGTANCVRYAQAQEKEIVRINPKELTT